MSIDRTLPGAKFLDELEAAFPGFLLRAVDAWTISRGQGYPRDVWICRQLEGFAALRGCELTANIVRHALDRHGLIAKQPMPSPGASQLREIVREEIELSLLPYVQELSALVQEVRGGAGRVA